MKLDWIFDIKIGFLSQIYRYQEIQNSTTALQGDILFFIPYFYIKNIEFRDRFFLY